MDNRVGWLKNLNEGDEVIISTVYNSHVRTISCIATNGFIEVGSIRFDPTGEHTEHMSEYKILECTSERKRRIKEQEEKEYITNRLNCVLDNGNCSIEELRRMWDACKYSSGG